MDEQAHLLMTFMNTVSGTLCGRPTHQPLCVCVNVLPTVQYEGVYVILCVMKMIRMEEMYGIVFGAIVRLIVRIRVRLHVIVLVLSAVAVAVWCGLYMQFAKSDIPIHVQISPNVYDFNDCMWLVGGV